MFSIFADWNRHPVSDEGKEIGADAQPDDNSPEDEYGFSEVIISLRCSLWKIYIIIRVPEMMCEASVPPHLRLGQRYDIMVKQTI